MEKQPGTRPIEGAALIVATLAAFITPFMSSSINIALPAIAQEFNMNAILLSWVPTAQVLAAAVFLVPFGRIADIYGRKRIFIYGIYVYTAATILSVVSTSALMLISFRVLQGIGAAMTFGTGVAILTSVFPPGERGRVLGINSAATYLGLSLGPFLGGLLTGHFGWRSIFLATVPIGLTIMVITWWKLKGEWGEAKGEKFDLSGSLIYGIAIIAIMYGFSLLPTPAGIWTVILGLLGVAIFIWWEGRQANPVIHMDLFRHSPVFAFSNLAALINYGATFAVTFLMSLYLQNIKGFSPQVAGFVLLSMPAVQALFSPIAGRLSDRIEPRIISSTGMALGTIGLAMLVFLGQNTPIWYIMASLIIIGFGFALFSSPNTNAIMSSVQKKFYGLASATLSTMRQLGFMVSMGITMLIFAIYIGRVEITPAYYGVFLGSLKPAFLIYTVLSFGGIFASLARGKVRPKA
ncbi:MAG: MFS transporter [Chloroflexota bacterium]|nr:MFS transporter [Chloroflexota bacterium]